MRKKIFTWLGKEFMALSCEGTGSSAAEQTQDIFRRMSAELNGAGLSMDHTVRSRLWARDRESRNSASQIRSKILSGPARSAGSSYIAPEHFESSASVALDLLAMRASRPGLKKTLKEYDPPVTPLRYLEYDSIIFLSGDSEAARTLNDQVDAIASRLSNSLAEAASSWQQAVKISYFIHRSQDIRNLNRLWNEIVRAEVRNPEYIFVDGYSREGKLIEIEVTAVPE